MRSPKDMQVIDIEITNFCPILCSNCTRFCGHHKKPFFMDFETFRKAVDSMDGFAGVVGILGGEPTLHPQFEKFADYFKNHFGLKECSTSLRRPVKDFIGYILTHAFNYNNSSINKRGLWSSTGKGYYKHFEAIQDTFGYQVINDHINPSTHLSLMITRKELGIPDDEWVKLRDNCWIQNTWSADITPKGAFFCEIAASLDYLLDGPGGWPIEKGWWLREPKDFKEQLGWCELCSAALPVSKRSAKEGIDDISPIWYEKLKLMGSPKLRKGKYKIFDTKKYSPDDYNLGCSYLDDNRLRINGTNKSLNPKHIDILLCIPGGLEKQDIEGIVYANIKNNITPSLIVSQDDILVIAQKHSIPFLKLEKNKNDTEDLHKILKTNDWIILFENRTNLNLIEFKQNLFNYVFNPGCLYIFSNSKNKQNNDDMLFFNLKAGSIRSDFSLLNIKNYYDEDKVVKLDVDFIAELYCYNTHEDNIFNLKEDYYNSTQYGYLTDNEKYIVDKIKASKLFDVPFYKITYVDVALSGIDPIIHYVKFGANEGRKPNEWFDTKNYADKYKDIRESKVNPFYHYIIYGKNEGRTI